MSAISTYLEYIRSKIYAKDVRTAIVNAISQCYNDVNKPALQTEAMEAAVQAKIDSGEMAALTIADGSLTGSKLANGTITANKIANGVIPDIDTTFSQSGAAADSKAVGDKFIETEEYNLARAQKLMNLFPSGTANGLIASFEGDGNLLKSLIVNIDAMQTGTGDPSPDNIRTISGRTSTVIMNNDESLTINWSDVAGTIYGGTLNVTTGVLIKTHAFEELPVSGWGLSGGVNFWHNRSGMSLTSPAKVGKCSHYKCNTNISGDKVIIFGRAGFSANSRYVIRDNRFTTVSDFEAYLLAQKEAETPVTVAYPLANPQTYRLAPNEIRTIIGENSVSSNAGEVHVEYFMDITKYITDIATNVVQLLLVDVDSELSDTSENPVQNKAITGEIKVTADQISALISQLQ